MLSFFFFLYLILFQVTNVFEQQMFQQVAMKHPSAVTACNLDLENLITDSNRSIATLAITTLLKTGSESSVDRLMKQISSFVSEISDEFKVTSSPRQHILDAYSGVYVFY